MINIKDCLFLLTIGLVLFLTMPGYIYPGDAVSIRMSSISVIQTGELSVPAEIAKAFGERGQYFFENTNTDKWYPKYGVMSTLTYLPPLFVEQFFTDELLPYRELNSHGHLRRTLFLNLYNIFLSCALAGYLLALAKRYTSRRWLAYAYIVFAFFGTFLWNYLRAHTVELQQVLFFTAAFFHLVRYHDLATKQDSPKSRFDAVVSMSFVGALALGKLVFAPLILLFFLGLFFSDCQSNKKNIARQFRIWLPYAIPGLITCLLIVAANQHRFGSPFTTGYAQWVKETNFITSDPTSGLWGYLFDPRYGIFLNFTLLVFAGLGLRKHCEKFRWEFIFSTFVFVLFYVLNSFFINWKGTWCLGPRYLLFVLPVLSLPAVTWIDRLAANPNFLVKTFWSLVLGAVFCVSVSNQMLVNSLEWFSPYKAEAILSPYQNQNVTEYYNNRSHASLNADLFRSVYLKKPYPPLVLLASSLRPEQLQEAEKQLRDIPVLNYYWFVARK